MKEKIVKMVNLKFIRRRAITVPKEAKMAVNIWSTFFKYWTVLSVKLDIADMGSLLFWFIWNIYFWCNSFENAFDVKSTPTELEK